MFINPVPQSAWDLKFRLFKVEARVHPSFWLGGLLFARNSGDMVHLAAGVALLFVSILVHEMGHALAGRYFGDRAPSVSLYVMGGFYQAGSARLQYGKFIGMCLCGPLAGFLLGAAAFGAMVAISLHYIPKNELLEFVLINAFYINAIWGLVNLLPVFPLDGGQIFRELLRWKFPRQGDVLCFTVSMVVGIAVAMIGLALNYLFDFGLFMALLFGSMAWQNYQFRKIALLSRGHAEDEDEQPRQAWERDADWWKKG